MTYGGYPFQIHAMTRWEVHRLVESARSIPLESSYIPIMTVISAAAVSDRERGGGGQSITRSVEDADETRIRSRPRIPPAFHAEGGNNYRREPRCTSRRATIITELFRPPHVGEERPGRGGRAGSTRSLSLFFLRFSCSLSPPAAPSLSVAMYALVCVGRACVRVPQGESASSGRS